LPEKQYKNCDIRECDKQRKCIGFEVLTALAMMSSIFWDITPCDLFENQLTFRGNIPRSSSGSKNKPGYTFYADLWFGSLFYPEDGGDVYRLSFSGLHSTQLARKKKKGIV
jgi:hypothetical protein